MASSLQLDWTFGFSKELIGGVHNLSSPERCAVFYTAGNAGVVYDFLNKRQMLLQGHVNPITCCCVSEDRKWIVTADEGADALLVVWDSFSGLPVKTYLNPHANGTVAIDMSWDGQFLATLSSSIDDQQDISLWQWSKEENDPLLSAQIHKNFQQAVKFNPANVKSLVSTGSSSIIAWQWNEEELAGYAGSARASDFTSPIGDFTVSCFLPESEKIVSATQQGNIVLWESTASPNVMSSSAAITITKAIKLFEAAIWCLDVVGEDYIVAAGDDGSVKFFDFDFRVEAWFEDIDAGPIRSLSFSKEPPPPVPSVPSALSLASPIDSPSTGPKGSTFVVPTFIVSTKEAFVVEITAAMFYEISPENRRGTLLVQGITDEVLTVASNPVEPQLAIASADSKIQLWDMTAKQLMMVKELEEGAMPVSMTFNQKGTCLAVGLSSGKLLLLNVPSLDDLTSFTSCEEPLVETIFSPSGKYLVSSDYDGYVCVYEDMNAQSTSQNSMEDFFGGSDDQKEEQEEQEGDFVKETMKENESHMSTSHSPPSFVYLGRMKSHKTKAASICFNTSIGGEEVLVSVGEDARLIEYDLKESTVGSGIQIVRREPVKRPKGMTSSMMELSQHEGSLSRESFEKEEEEEEDDDDDAYDYMDPRKAYGKGFDWIEVEGTSSVKPTCALWHPRQGPSSFEDKLIIMNSNMKAREWNLESQKCRKTTLAPSFGGPITKLIPLTPHQDERVSSFEEEEDTDSFDESHLAKPYPAYVAFKTSGQVIGIMKLPLDGNPHRATGLVAHSDRVSAIALSHDSEFLISSGGKDMTVNVWKIQRDVIEAMSGEESDLSEESAMVPFFSLLEGGYGGQVHQDIRDYFYLEQIKEVGIHHIQERELMDTVSIKGLSSIMRALGWYLSSEEEQSMMDELEFQSIYETGLPCSRINMNTIIKLYVNHKPPGGVSMTEVEDAFAKLTNDEFEGTLSWKRIQKLLMKEGEKLEREELQELLRHLLYEESGLSDLDLSAQDFIQHVLGFE